MWDLIVSVPDHCLSFYFSVIAPLLFNLFIADIYKEIGSERV